mgnify:CR=1 FL=1
MNHLSEKEVLVMQELFARYRDFAIQMFEKNDNSNNKCGSENLIKLCEEAMVNTQKYPSDKMHRWLGFVQGVLAAQGIIDVDVERDYTRPLFHGLYDEWVPSFDSK